MAWSVAYKRRNELMSNLEIPTITETRKQLGDRLASLVFEQCPEAMRGDLGLEPLEGPGDDLWISPSNVLKGNISFSPLNTKKYVQALTHQGILEIGDQIEQKYRNYLDKLHKKEIERIEDYMKALCEIQKNRLADQLRKEEYDKYAHQLEMAIAYYEKKIDILIEAFRKEVREQEMKAEDDLRQLDRKWNEMCQEELTKATEAVLTMAQNQQGAIVLKLYQKLKRMQAKEAKIVECIRAKYKKTLGQLKLDLHRQHSQKLQQTLNSERKKYKTELAELQRYYRNEIEELANLVGDQKQQIDELVNIKNDKIEQIKEREKYLREIIRQFKKFIYYALKSMPTQAEFLLDTEKLEFEIDDKCSVGKRVKPQESSQDRLEVEESESSMKIFELKSRLKPYSQFESEEHEECEKSYFTSLLEAIDSLILLREKFTKKDTEMPVYKAESKDESLKIETNIPKLVTVRDSVLLRIRKFEKQSINAVKLMKKPDETSPTLLQRLSRRSIDECTITRTKLAMHTDSLEIIRASSKISVRKVEKKSDDSVKKQSKKSKTEEQTYRIPPCKDVIKTRTKSKLYKKKIKSKKSEVDAIFKKHPEEFTAERIQSLVNLLKANKSLRQLFTSVTR